jgi:two-component system, NarL family, response regulator YdfI
MIRVLLKASSPFVKAGLASLLRLYPDLHVLEDVAENTGRIEAQVLADVLLAEANTIADAIARGAMDWAGAGGQVVLLIRDPVLESFAEALRAGVKAVLPSGTDGPEIVVAIEAAAAGLFVLDAPSVESLLQSPRTVAAGKPETLPEPLTARELEVLGLLAAGLSNKEIASRLSISGHTVKFHVASIMGKLGASSRTEAVTIGIHRGMVMI